MILYFALYFFKEDVSEIEFFPSDSLNVSLRLLPASESRLLYFMRTTALQAFIKLTGNLE